MFKLVIYKFNFFPLKLWWQLWFLFSFLKKKSIFSLKYGNYGPFLSPPKNPLNEPSLLLFGVVKWEKDCHQKNAEILQWSNALVGGLLRRSNNEGFF
jgi:hypothetical protein